MLTVSPGPHLRADFTTKSSSSVGLVSNLFRGSWPESLASRLECLYLNGTLQPATAAIGRLLSRPCVVGKSILMEILRVHASRRIYRELLSR